MAANSCTPFSEVQGWPAPAVDARTVCTPLESRVAFFGAADGKPHLYVLTVALLSAHRFHPAAGYYALMPQGEAEACRRAEHPFSMWSRGVVRALPLDAASATQFGSGGGYSRYTFHRHAVPEMLAARGYDFSINLDPDVITLRPWDLRVLLEVRLIAGRQVGRGSRTVRWLQERLEANAQAGISGGERAAAGVEGFLSRTLNTTRWALERTPEINGGVLVFNNAAAVKAQWLLTCVRRYAALHAVVEGDQDLISLVLAANRSLPRASLPTVYNYAFRRDRERLPYREAKRLRHGVFEGVAVSIHFVADGKPWQRQNLTTYPSWLAAARLWYVNQWHELSRSVRPGLLQSLSHQELSAFGDLEPLRVAQNPNLTLLGVADSTARLSCRCFVRGLLSGGQKPDPAELLAGARGVGKRQGRPEFDALVESVEDRAEALRALTQRQRGVLLQECGGSSSTHEEQSCKAIADAESRRRAASTSARATVNSTIADLYPAFLRFLDEHKAVPVKSVYADVHQCDLAHWYARIKQASTPPRMELTRKIGTANVEALIARVAALPKLRKPRGAVRLSDSPCKRSLSSRGRLVSSPPAASRSPGVQQILMHTQNHRTRRRRRHFDAVAAEPTPAPT